MPKWWRGRKRFRILTELVLGSKQYPDKVSVMQLFVL